MDIQILEKFHKSLVTFFDELIEMFPNEKEFILLRILIKDRIPSTQIMEYFQIVASKEEIMSSIKKRDDQFFLQNVLFSKINKSDIFKNIWLSKLDDNDREMIWNWVDAFMKMTISYTEECSKK
jgi:hypothetical protein